MAMERQMHHRKAQERAVLDHFIDCTGLLKGSRVIVGESPDFRCRLNRHRAIGVELVMALTPDDIADAIRVKTGKLSIYRKKRLDEYWLLIWSDFLEPGPFLYRFREEIGSDTYQRVFVFSLFHSSSVELTAPEEDSA